MGCAIRVGITDWWVPWLWDIKHITSTNIHGIITSAKYCTSKVLGLCLCTLHGSKYHSHQVCKDFHNEGCRILQQWDPSCFDWLPWPLWLSNPLDLQQIQRGGELLQGWTLNESPMKAHTLGCVSLLATPVKSDCSQHFRPPTPVFPECFCGHKISWHLGEKVLNLIFNTQSHLSPTRTCMCERAGLRIT